MSFDYRILCKLLSVHSLFIIPAKEVLVELCRAGTKLVRRLFLQKMEFSYLLDNNKQQISIAFSPQNWLNCILFKKVLFYCSSWVPVSF